MLEPGTDIGAYRIEGLLGRGGMGIVYEATQHSLGRKVALKLLTAELSLDESFRNRFRREGRIQAGLDHAHIVPIYEAGELEDHGLFIAMRLVRGSTLKELIKRGELDAVRALRVLRPVADALDTAHEAQLVHRDIKPQNILVGRRDHVYLADFGLTRAPGDTAFTKTGQFVGTLDYVAPEQIRGEAPGPASDLYSLAAVAYECLTGTVPFPKPTEAAILFAHMSDPPPRASALRPVLPEAVDDVLAAGMAKLPAERPRSVLEFVEALEDALGPVPAAGPAAPPPPPPDLYPASSPSPSLAEAADASTVLPEQARTTVPLELTATAPLVEPQQAVTEAAEAGEITEIHERSGAVTRPDQRRAWSPGQPPVPDEPFAEEDVADEVVLDEVVADEVVADEVVAEDVVPDEIVADEVVLDEVVADELLTEEIDRDDVVADEVVADEVAADEVVADEAVAAGEVVEGEGAAAADGVVVADGVSAGSVAGSAVAGPVVARRSRRSLPVALGGAALLVVAVVAGLVAGGSGEREAASPAAAPRPVAFAAGPLELRGPAGWGAREAPELPGLELRDAAAVGSGDGTMVAGMTDATGPALLPATFSRRLPDKASPDGAVRVGAAQAYRFAGLRPRGADGDITVLVAPTTAGIATVACLGSADERRACEAAAASLALGDGVRAFRLGPSERYARELKAALDRLAAKRTKRLRKLGAAGTPSRQASAASGIASTYRAAAKSLAAVQPNPPERQAHAALRRAVARADEAYGALATAARRHERSAYARAEKRAHAADGAVNGALAELNSLGYRVR